MNAHDVQQADTAVLACPTPSRLIDRRRRLCGYLTLTMLGAYFGFILTLAFKPGLLATALPGVTLTWGIVVGIGMFVLTFFIVAIYVGWANRVFDPLVARLHEGAQS
jgi:uncharacterized membrane protein (DUF485 family)